MSFLFSMCGGGVIGPQDYMLDLRYPFYKTFHKKWANNKLSFNNKMLIRIEKNNESYFLIVAKKGKYI